MAEQAQRSNWCSPLILSWEFDDQGEKLNAGVCARSVLAQCILWIL